MTRRSIVTCKRCQKEESVPNSRAKYYVYCSRECMSKDYVKTEFNVGDMINNWKVISDKHIRKYGRCYILVQCTCGSNIKRPILIDNIKSNKQRGCGECSRQAAFKGYCGISGTTWAYLLQSAKRRNIEFNITIEFIWDLFIKQQELCALTGLPIAFEKKSVRIGSFDSRRMVTASLDRIDSTKGYVEDNIQWVHKDVNIMKNKFNQDYFKQICELVCKNV